MLVDLSKKHRSHGITMNGHNSSVMSPYFVKVIAGYETKPK